MTPYPYQEACISQIIKSIYIDNEILIQACTSAGKTIIFCELCKRLLTKWPHLRICILMHREVLVSQTADKMRTVWPESPIGIGCKSIASKVKTNQKITIGTIQTLANRIHETEKFNLIIIDEVHRVPPMNRPNQYSKYIDQMREWNPKLKTIGFTATPYRLGHGYIFGTRCKKGAINLFRHLHFRISISELQAQGYISQFKAKEVVNIQKELSVLGKQGGDYSLADSSDELSKDIHIGSAVKALQDYASSRKHIVCFATTISHAEKLFDAFSKLWPTGILHSKLKDDIRKQVLSDFDTGKIRIIINVGILTEGWDSPHVDCILMCRNTLSPALFVQMLGRGLRKLIGKIDVLVLDLVNNFRTHGHPDKPHVHIPNGKPMEKQAAKNKTCPNCKEILPLGTRECPECGTLLVEEKKEINSKVEMIDVNFEPVIKKVSIKSSSLVSFTSKKGAFMSKLLLTCKDRNNMIPINVNTFFDFEGNTGQAFQSRSITEWKKLVGTSPPLTTLEAEHRKGELLMSLPDEIQIVQKGKYWNLYKWQG